MSAATLDIRKLHLPTGPSEWEAVDPEVLASLHAPTGILTPEQWQTIQGIWGKRWFLVRADTGKCSRCRRCGAFHRYITLGCIPRPWNGITEIFGVLEKSFGRDTVWETVRFGDIVPITRADALKLYEQIRAKGLSF